MQKERTKQKNRSEFAKNLEIVFDPAPAPEAYPSFLYNIYKFRTVYRSTVVNNGHVRDIAVA